MGAPNHNARNSIAAEREATERATGARSPSLFFVAGEASGDWAGALLAEALRRKRPEIRLRGVGGQRMSGAGVELVADSSDWGAIGVADALRKIPGVYREVQMLKARLAEERPSGLVLIDAGAVNVRLARMVQGCGLKILYYLPPGSWSRKPRSQAVRDLVDVIATPYPWSRDLLSGGRARVEWVGHPVLETARPKLSAEQAWERCGLDRRRPVVALAPGSRGQEMRCVLPVMARAAALLAKRSKGTQFLLPLSNPAYEDRVRQALRRVGVEALLLQGMEYDALQLAGAAAVCSGTATLEFACLGLPMVVVYKASPGTTLQFLLVRGVIGKQWRAAMPNIIAGRDVVPELLWKHAKPEAVARELSSLLEDRERRQQMQWDLAEVVRSLGEPGASDRTADLVLEMIADESTLAAVGERDASPDTA